MKKATLITLLIISSAFMLISQNNNTMDNKIQNIISQLTLEEKASLCSGRDDWSSEPIERLDIPWVWMADGPHGLRRAPETNKPGYGDQLPATCFPTASALAATWDAKLIYDVGVALGEECQALDVGVLLGPGVNIKRSPLGGRNFEYFSEDPILSGEIGAAFINGVQSQGVGTSLKHFAANNTETMRMYMNSDVDTRTLNEIYLKPFEIAVKKAQPWTIMACYNRVQGEYGTQSEYLLQQKLRNEWGYEGIVISDWFAVVDRVKGIKSGMNIEMPGVNIVNDSLIVEAVKNGTLDEQVLDRIVADVIRFALKAESLKKQNADQKIDDHHQLARKVASESVTLLKNNNDLLPVTREKYKKIAIIGEFASNPRYQGNGSSEVKPSKLDNFKTIVENELGNDYKLVFSKGYDLKNDGDLSGIADAVKIARNSDVVLLFAGLPQSYESEGIDRTHINLPHSHNKLIEEISKVNSNVAVVLTNGSAVAMPWADDVKAIVEGWLAGQAGAGGIADVLFGKINPSGKLAETFPKKLNDTPSYFNYPGENGNALYGERIFVGYRYYDIKDIEPLFPFGHGLSYTTFNYGTPTISKYTIVGNEDLVINISISNTGATKGKEVVQLYITDNESNLIRPVKELKKFEKIELSPGEEKLVSFKIEADDLAYFDDSKDMWIKESGNYKVLIGSSSRDIRQTIKFNYESDQKVPYNFDEYTFFSEYWKVPETRAYLKQIMPNWIGGYVPEGKTLDEAQFQDFFIEHPIIKYPYISYGECTREQINELIKISKSLTFTP